MLIINSYPALKMKAQYLLRLSDTPLPANRPVGKATNDPFVRPVSTHLALLLGVWYEVGTIVAKEKPGLLGPAVDYLLSL